MGRVRGRSLGSTPHQESLHTRTCFLLCKMGRDISWLRAVKLFVTHVCKAVKDLNCGWALSLTVYKMIVCRFKNSLGIKRECKWRLLSGPFRPAALHRSLPAPHFGFPNLGGPQRLFSGKAHGWPHGIHVLLRRAPAGWVTPGREATVLGVRGGEASDVRVTAYHS